MSKDTSKKTNGSELKKERLGPVNGGNGPVTGGGNGPVNGGGNTDDPFAKYIGYEWPDPDPNFGPAVSGYDDSIPPIPR